MGLFGKMFGKEEKKESCCCEMEIVELPEGEEAIDTCDCDCGCRTSQAPLPGTLTESGGWRNIFKSIN